jgi:hypothetical protein
MVGISDPHIRVKPKFGVSTGCAGMNMDGLARIALVRKEEKTNAIQTEDNGHAMGSEPEAR